MKTATVKSTAISQVLQQLREVIDERERLSEQDRRLSKEKEQLERQLHEFHETTGLESFTAAGLSVTFDDGAMRPQYDPEQWTGIFKWAAETGNDHIVQRRLSEGKVLELATSGVALPPGLSLESFSKISVRRK